MNEEKDTCNIILTDDNAEKLTEKKFKRKKTIHKNGCRLWCWYLKKWIYKELCLAYEMCSLYQKKV